MKRRVTAGRKPCYARAQRQFERTALVVTRTDVGVPLPTRHEIVDDKMQDGREVPQDLQFDWLVLVL